MVKNVSQVVQSDEQTPFFQTSKSKIVSFGTGRRKKAVAKVILRRCSSHSLHQNAIRLIINKKSGYDYLQHNPYYINTVHLPLITLGYLQDYVIYVILHGGGLKGQADAIKLGVARALCYLFPAKRLLLKSEKTLIRDARKKERKKYGLRKARKSPQFSKR